MPVRNDKLDPSLTVPASSWQSMSPGQKQAWLLGQALDCKRDILTMLAGPKRR
jgi:hypothetical protein